MLSLFFFVWWSSFWVGVATVISASQTSTLKWTCFIQPLLIQNLSTLKWTCFIQPLLIQNFLWSLWKFYTQFPKGESKLIPLARLWKGFYHFHFWNISLYLEPSNRNLQFHLPFFDAICNWNAIMEICKWSLFFANAPISGMRGVCLLR